MTPKDLLLLAIDPAIKFLATEGVRSDDRARVEVLAIAGQETDWMARLQGGGGPARSFWQFEGPPSGGVSEVFARTPALLEASCKWLLVPYDQATVFNVMAWNDILAAIMARLLLWQDPAALPAVGDVQSGWDYYKRNWNPGVPRPEVWPARYATARAIVEANPL